MTLALKPSPSQQADLDKLLAEQQDPSSSNYHHWLTPDEYADRFGASSDDINKMVAWLGQQGLTVGGAREWIVMSNPDIDPSMTVWYYDSDTNGQDRCFYVPL